MKYLSKLLILLLSITVLSCKGQTTENIKSIDAKSFLDKIKATSKAQIIDVRTPDEFQSEHIDSAVNIDWFSENFGAIASKFDKSKPVFVYCKSGGRSSQASNKLAKLGFKTIYELEGGIMKWNAAGLSKKSNKIVGMTGEQYAGLLNTDKKVLIDFYAEWCAPCKKMKPFLLKMEKELAAKVFIIRLDADKNKTLIQEMKIDGLPTLILYENKKIKWKHSGFIGEEDLKKQLQ